MMKIEMTEKELKTILRGCGERAFADSECKDLYDRLSRIEEGAEDPLTRERTPPLNKTKVHATLKQTGVRYQVMELEVTHTGTYPTNHDVVEALDKIDWAEGDEDCSWDDWESVDGTTLEGFYLEGEDE